MSVIAAQNLSKTYGKKDNIFNALKEVSLEIKKGESVAILGKSGSGKSTLMHILATLDRPTSGALTISDQDTSKLHTKALNRLRNQQIGFIFQQFFLNPQQTVLENVALPLKIAGVSARQRTKRAQAILESVDMVDKAKQKAVNLSGGQKQRVCIARALVTKPQIIFADEPTGNLDSETGAAVMKLLDELHKEHGITLIIVTHDNDIAASCQRQIHIKDGQLVGAK